MAFTERAFDSERFLLSTSLLAGMVGTYVAFLAKLYSSPERASYEEVPVITWLEQHHVEATQTYMLALGLSGLVAFLANVDIYYRFVDDPALFSIGSTCFVAGLIAIVMQAYTLTPAGEKFDPDLRDAHQAWVVVFAVGFLTAMLVYTRTSWKRGHIPYSRSFLFATALLGAGLYVSMYHYRHERAGFLAAAAVGQNLLLMSSLLFYASTVRELADPCSRTERPCFRCGDGSAFRFVSLPRKLSSAEEQLRAATAPKGAGPVRFSSAKSSSALGPSGTCAAASGTSREDPPMHRAQGYARAELQTFGGTAENHGASKGERAK